MNDAWAGAGCWFEIVCAMELPLCPRPISSFCWWENWDPRRKRQSKVAKLVSGRVRLESRVWVSETSLLSAYVMVLLLGQRQKIEQFRILLFPLCYIARICPLLKNKKEMPICDPHSPLLSTLEPLTQEVASNAWYEAVDMNGGGGGTQRKKIWLHLCCLFTQELKCSLLYFSVEGHVGQPHAGIWVCNSHQMSQKRVKHRVFLAGIFELVPITIKKKKKRPPLYYMAM